MLSKNNVFNKTMENLMTLLRMSIENPEVADTFFHQAFGAVELAMLLLPDEKEELTVAWNAWKQSYENLQKLWKKA